MKFPYLLLCLLAVFPVGSLAAEQAAPEKALKYHEALLKHPNNPTVFSRFYDAWIDSESLESLEAFLKGRAESEGGIHYALLARYQLRRGQDANALLSLNKAIESTPAAPALLMERAQLLSRRLDFPSARKDLETVTTLGNEALCIEAFKLIGKSHLREGNPQAAIQAWEKLLATHPANEDLLEDLVELAASADQAAQALVYSDKLIAASTDPYKKALRLIRRGELLSASGNSDQALAVWTETLTQTGEGSWLEREILAHIEQSFRRLDRLDLLATKLEELAKAHPRRLLIHRELAKREAAAGNIDSAIGRFREVLRRSPGEPELREEFIRLLIQSERFDDAAAELGKLLAATPDNAELHLRLAELIYQKFQANPDLDKTTTSAEIRKSLEKARGLLDPGEASGLRIAQLMIRYGREENGEALLQELSTRAGASTAPAEALAAEYARTKRPAKAVEILTQLSKAPDPETILRATSAMAPLAPPETAFHILQSRLSEFQNNAPYLANYIQTALSAKKPADAIPSALRLVRASKLGSEIHDAVQLAKTTIIAAEKSPHHIAELSAIETRSAAETCLLATLLETQKEHAKSDALFQNATDPVLLRFHSSLLSARGDFKAAIAALTMLAGPSTDAGTAYFKELSDLQLRSGDSQSCIKTLEQWKVASPTDKTPWTIATRLLRESAQFPKAIESARSALSRFPNDEDLTAILADLHQQAGDHAEAERIYWKLYDQAPDTSAQSRWAARLATLAHAQSRTAELKENFLQRSRGNRQSIGPILSLVELARATDNEEAVLEHLYQALRIKPADIDIRLQIASAEKQSGNLERQISVLNDGIAHDSANRIRTSLAQALIDQGHVIQGMRMLRALSGDKASDPRLIESAAISIATTGMIAEAIQYIQESLPTGMDWRTRFLLAILLQMDGREGDAADLYFTLIGENTEIAGLMPSEQARYLDPRMRNGQTARANNFPVMMQLVTQEIQQARYSGQRLDFQRMLPSSPIEVRYRALARITMMAKMSIPELTAKINAAAIPDLPFITDVVAHTAEGSADYSALLEKHADRPDLLLFILQQGYDLDDPKKSKTSLLDVMRRLKDAPGVDDKLRLMFLQRALGRHPAKHELWEELVTLSEKIIQADADSTDESVAEALFTILRAQKAKNAIPAALLPRMKTILLRYAQRRIGENADIRHRDPQALLMAIHGMFGEVEPWIEIANASVRTHREKMEETLGKMRTQWAASPSQRGVHYVQMGDHYMFAYGLPVTSLPREHLYAIAPAKSEEEEYRMAGSRLAATDFIPHLDKLESPLFRVWIALQSGNENAIRKALVAKVPAIEVDDLRILQTYHHIKSGKPADACRLLLALAESSADKPWIHHWADGCFLSLCLKLPENQRKEFDPNARKILLSLQAPAQADPYASNRLQALSETAQQLGFADIHKSITESLVAASTAAQARSQPGRPQFNPHTGASIGKPVSIQNSQPAQPRKPLTALDRYQNFTSEGKHRAAAHELLQWVKKQKQVGNEIERILAEVKTTPQVRAEILALSDPGTAPGLTKRMEYVGICQALEESAKALAALQSLAAERPFDPRIQIALAFALPPQDIETAANLLKKVAYSPELNDAIQKAQRRASAMRKNDQTFAFFELLARYFELAAPIPRNRQHESNSLNQLAEYFLSASYLQNIPSLLVPPGTPKEETPDIRKHREISQKLTRAMLRHPAHAEFAFRAMRSARWLEDPAETDTLARSCLVFDTTPTGERESFESNLDKFSSIRWLCARIQESVPQETLLPTDFLRALADNNPSLPTLLVAVYQTKSTKDIQALWESGAMSLRASSYSPASILQQAVLEKVATVPGSIDFFAARIRALDKEDAWKKRSSSTGEYEHACLFRAALLACRNQSEKNIAGICSVIATTLYGKNPIPEEIARNQEARGLSHGIFSNLSLDSVTAIRITRAFDSLRIPIDIYWLSNAFQQGRITDSAQAIEWLDTMGFLKDSAEWSPLAHYTIQSRSGRSAGEPNNLLERVYLGETILQNLDYKVRTKEFATQLANRKPQTFGALITAATIAASSGERKSAPIAMAAFQHAAKYLAKAPANRLDEFAWVVHYLPYESRDILPPSLQDVIRKQHESKIAAIHKQIDEQFQQIAQNPSQSALRSVQSQIVKLAGYDLDAAIGIFQQAHKIDLEHAKHHKPNEPSHFRESFSYVIQSISQAKDINPTSVFRFYQAIRKSPQGASFGIGAPNDSSTYLDKIGYSILSRHSEDIPRDKPSWLQPWIAANRITGEYHTTALAAAACFRLMNRDMIPIDQAEKHLQLLPDLSDKTREIALACQAVVQFKNKDPERAAAREQAFLRLLGHQDFDDATRLQIAYCAAFRTPDILFHPAAAAAFCKVFIPHCAAEFSVVDSMTKSIVASMADMQPTPESLPYLRQINEAFWNNAHTPKSDPHQTIEEQTAIRLFFASTRIGDDERTKSLLPHVRAALTGQLYAIVPLILADQHQFARELLPDDATNYSITNGMEMNYNEGMVQKMDAFAQAIPLPARALRFECQLMRYIRLTQGTSALKMLANRKPGLIERYRKLALDAPALRIEIVASLVEESHPIPAELENEIDEIAAGIDAKQSMLEWLRQSKSSSKHFLNLPGVHANRILYAAAMSRLLKGDPSAFVSLCDHITSIITQAKYDNQYFLNQLTQSFVISSYRTVMHAVVENKTTGFSPIIRPLRDLASAVLVIQDSNTIGACRGLHDFISHWENKPDEGQATGIMQFPRKTFPFIESLSNLHNSIQPPFGEHPEKLITAILSRSSLSPLLPTETSWLRRMQYNGCQKAIGELVKSPPDTITSEGRALLKYHEASQNLRGKEAMEAFQEALKGLPNTPSWNGIRIECTLRVVLEMILQKQDLAEIRILFDNIDTAQISENKKSLYQSTLKNLEAAEARQKKEAP